MNQLISIKQVLPPRKQHKVLLLGHCQTPNHPGASLDRTRVYLSSKDSAHGPLLFTLPTGMHFVVNNDIHCVGHLEIKM